MITLLICGFEQHRNKIAIHLNGPDLWYLNDALDVAEKDNFETIVLHYETIGPALYKIPYDVLNRLVEILQLDDAENSFQVIFEQPATLFVLG